MRMTHSVARRLACWCVVAIVAGAETARAQVANNGALDLLVPIGARSTGMGTAFAAEEGSEAIWWNPAGVARLTRTDFALDHLENFILKGDAVSFVAPIRGLGAVGLTARLFNYCSDCATTDTLGNVTGALLERSIVVGGTFASTFGSRVNAGVTYRIYQFRNDCSGSCPAEALGSATTSAVDLGVQFRPSATAPLRIGLALRNLGPRLQVKDQPQADPLPARLDAGASYEPHFTGQAPELKLRVTSDLVTTLGLASPEVHLGAQAGYLAGTATLLVRGGYVLHESTGGESNTGPSLGLGLASGRVQLDLARIFESFSSGLGKPPTYISIRVGL
jgi:hypothetical protein